MKLLNFFLISVLVISSSFIAKKYYNYKITTDKVIHYEKLIKNYNKLSKNDCIKIQNDINKIWLHYKINKNILNNNIFSKKKDFIKKPICL